MRTLSTLALATLVTALLHAPSWATGRATVILRPGSQAGSVTITIKDGIYRTGTRAPFDLRLTVPTGVARQLASAAGRGGLTVSTTNGYRGNMVRLIAGTGADAVILDRSRNSYPNGQAGVDGTIRVQYGLGTSTTALYYGRTRGAGAVDLGGGAFRGTSTVTRSGRPSLIDPTTLGVDTQAKLDGSTLRWYMKPVGTSNRTRSPASALRAFHQGDAAAKGVTAKPADLVISLGE